jgi:adenylylsulfate kinase-like enzyme
MEVTDDPPIFIITGVPGAGKSSVAMELMRRFEFGIHIPVDDLREFVVAGIAHPVPHWTTETSRQFGLARAAAGQIAALYNRAGFAVAIDDVISPADAQAAFDDLLAKHTLHKIRLYPKLEIALARSAARTTKPFDSVVLESAIRGLHGATAAEPYAAMGWLTIDNSRLTLEQTVDHVLECAGLRKMLQ